MSLLEVFSLDVFIKANTTLWIHLFKENKTHSFPCILGLCNTFPPAALIYLGAETTNSIWKSENKTGKNEWNEILDYLSI
jgi:hypothetical protein